ncbi:MAG: class I SAM-dependent methyltransferase [Magnetovibrionaceae bacterium]
MVKEDSTVQSDVTLAKHLRITEPSRWVMRFAPLIKPGGSVLDLAAGGGRHGRALLAAGHAVTLVDKNTAPLADLAQQAEVVQADLEDGSPWPLEGQGFDAIVVVNYLHRPLIPTLLDSLNPGGLFLYETFARGNEVYSRPRNPDHLLKSGELLELVGGRLQVIAYEHGIREAGPLPGVIQHIAGVKDLEGSEREDGEPTPHPIQPNID